MSEKLIWEFCKERGFNDYGAAGLMGNLYAESGLSANNLQNSKSKELGMTDEEYTIAVDNGTYTNFINDGAGYGLAQWTFWSRKQKLLEYAKACEVSVGNIAMQLWFLYNELTSYNGLIDTLCNATSILEASNAILLNYERPADQSVSMQQKRAQFGQKYYDKYATPEATITIPAATGISLTPPTQCLMKNSTCYKQTGRMAIKGILWHSTGANNPTLKRYVQPHESDANYNSMIQLIGKNRYGNDWNHIELQSGVHAFIGKLADGSVSTLQVLPWNYRSWGCGSGSNGSCNDGWIQFEICESALTDKEYFEQVYNEACRLTAYLCKLYGLNPHGTVKMKKAQVPVITCHAEAHQLGCGNNHGDILHWFPKHGKSMEDIRNDVANLIAAGQTSSEPSQEVPTPQAPISSTFGGMTTEDFAKHMDVYLTNLALQEPTWDKEYIDWGIKLGLLKGDEQGNIMAKKWINRGELMTILHRLLPEDEQ